jgi:ABC-type branched-subunit amino acid transport system substrate-binding protein
MKSFSKVLVIVLLLATGAQAQIFDQTERKYKEGVSYYRQGLYGLAMDRLAGITSSTNSNYSLWAHYYYALSAHKLNKYNESNMMLLQLLNRFSTWEQKDEAYYLLAANNMALGSHSKAFEYFNRIGDLQFDRDIKGLKQHYLDQVNNIQTLKTLNSEFPGDRIVSVALVKLIQTASSNKADLELSDKLTNQFGIGVVMNNVPVLEKDPPVNWYEKKWSKGYYNVAILFPYRIGDFNASVRSRSNQFAFDYYEGMQIAKKQLKTEGIVINVQAYDIGGDEDEKILDMLNNSHFRLSDIILGPLYEKPFELIAAFANENNITMVNPLASDGNLLKTSKWVYLARPSVQFQTQEAVKLVKSKTTSPRSAIYYGNSSKDSLMAFLFRDYLVKEGGKVLEMKELTGNASEMNEKMSLFPSEKPNNIAFFSNDPNSGAALMNVLIGRKLNNLPVVAVANGFGFNSRRPSGYGGNLYLIETEYVDTSKELVKNFQKLYYDKTNTLPSVYSYLGYDQMLFFGRMIGKYNDRMKDGLEMRKYENDFILSGFDYTKSRENSIPPLLKYENSRWIPWDNQF